MYKHELYSIRIENLAAKHAVLTKTSPTESEHGVFENSYPVVIILRTLIYEFQ